jgi:hypothetical protein
VTDINSVKILEGTFFVINSEWQKEEVTDLAAARGIATALLLSIILWSSFWLLGRLGGAW